MVVGEGSEGREEAGVSTSSKGERGLTAEATQAPHTSRVLVVARPSPAGELRVEVPGVGAVAARCLRSVDRESLRGDEAVGREVLVCFDGDDARRPIILGVMEDPVDALLERATQLPAVPEARVDGRRVVIEGADEVALVCGEASITITRDGRITLKGVNVTSEAGELQRIRGAVVKIN